MATAKAEREGLALLEIITSGAVLFLVTVILVILLQIVFFVMRDDEVVRKTVMSQEFELMKSEQVAVLNSGMRWINRDKGIVGMSLDQAFETVIRTNAPKAETR